MKIDRILAELAKSGYRRAFRAAPGADDARIFVDLGKALAAFLETQVTDRTPFDDFRDALARNDAAGRARYPAAAVHGLRLFGRPGQLLPVPFRPGLHQRRVRRCRRAAFRRTRPGRSRPAWRHP